MKLEQKHIVLIIGSLLVLTAIGVGIYLLTKNTDKEEKEETNDKDDSEDEPSDDPKDEPETNTSKPPVVTGAPGQIVPVFNEENELKNPISELKDRVLYPKRKYLGGWDYTNVRSSAAVNTEAAWYDPFDNLLVTIGAGTPIGKVVSATTTVHNTYPYRWFKVKLLKGVGFWGTTEGYVRADTVTFAPYYK